MKRYVFYCDVPALDAKALAAAKKVAQASGATVIRAVAGSMLLEVAAAQLETVSRALPGWRYGPERKTTRVPERTPLQRKRDGSGER